MSNFAILVTLPPRPWPFRWGPWGRSQRFNYHVADAATITIWQRGQSGRDGRCDEHRAMVISCDTGKASCTTKIELGNRSLRHRTRL